MCEIVHRHGMATKCEAGGGCSCNFALLWNFTSSFSSQRLPTNPYNKTVPMNWHNCNGCSWAQKLIGWQHLFNSLSRCNDKRWRNTFCFFGEIIQKKDNVPIASKQMNWCERGNKQIHTSMHFFIFSKQYFFIHYPDQTLQWDRTKKNPRDTAWEGPIALWVRRIASLSTSGDKANLTDSVN